MIRRLPGIVAVYLIAALFGLVFEVSKYQIAEYLDMHASLGAEVGFGILGVFMILLYVGLAVVAVVYALSTVRTKRTQAFLPLLIVFTAVIIYILLLVAGVIPVGGKTDKQREIIDNASRLEHQILNMATDYKVNPLTELTPFEWDKVLFFQAYTPKQYVYDRVGYRWDSIAETVSEGMMQIVFMKANKVICYVYGGIGYGEHYSLYSEREELYASDNPLFMVTRFPEGDPFEDYTNGSASLQWFDNRSVYIDYNTVLSPDIVGDWGKREEGVGSLNFLVTTEGLVSGRLGFSGTNEHSGAGGVSFIGVFIDGKAHCKTITGNQLRASNQSDDGVYEELAFDIVYHDGKFVLTVDFSDRLNFKYIDGVEANIDGNIVVGKRR